MRRQSSETEPGSISGWDAPATKAAVASGQVGHIGRGIRIKGTVRGREDLVVEGEVDGVIELPEHHVLLEGPARTKARLKANRATIRGRHRGNAEAGEKIEISAEGVVIGDLRSPRLVIKEGAKFRGSVDMDVDLPADLLGPGSGGGGKKAEAGKKDDGKKDDGKKDAKSKGDR